MTETKTTRLLAFVIAAALLAAGCAPRDHRGQFFGQIEPPQGQVLRYISGSEPETLDPQMSTGQPEARVAIALYEGLVEYHPKTMEAIPGVAERWTMNGDASELVFFLRRNAKFSNGDPITARDFVYGFRRGLRPALASRVAYLAYDIKYAEAFNNGSAFVRDPQTGRFLLASEAPQTSPDGSQTVAAAAAPPDEDALFKAELGKKGEDAAADTPFHKYIHAPERLVVPADAKDREKALKDAPKLAALVAGKEFVPVKEEDIGVEAVDDYTLRLTLRQPAPYFLGLLPHQFFRAIHEKTVERFGVNWTKPGNIVSSGTHMLLEHKPYNQVVVVKNPQYWDAAAVRLEKIVFYPLEDNTTMMNLYKAGDVDATYNHTVPASWLKSGVRNVKDYMDAPENVSEFYAINTTKPPMNDVRVRKAFNMAVDKAALADYRVVVKPNYTLVPTIFLKYPRPKGDPFDPERAKQLLAEAGFKGADGKFDPKKFPSSEVELNYNTNESNRQIAEFIQAQWKQNLGVTVALRNTEWKTFLPMRSRLEYKGFARSGWVGDYMDPYTYLSLYIVKEGGANGTGWWDPKYNKMLEDANRETDELKRFEMLAKAEEYLLEYQPVLTLVIPATSWMKKPYVKGMYPNPGTLHAWKFVYIEYDRAKWDQGTPDMTTDTLAD
ncbi:MAG: peptide ABC transporter substrate-binding protein [Pyrinomonadaceae bacterium]